MNKLLAQQIHAKKRNEDEFTWTVIGNAQSQIPYLNNGTGHSLTDICYNYLLTHFSDLGPQDYEKLIPEIKVKLIDFIARKRLVQDHILEGLCCHQLETLHLISCPPNLTDKGLEIIALKCPNLIDFRLSSCPSVTNVGVRLIAEHCTQLKHLNLTWSSFYDNDLLPILPLITNLKSLILRRCVNLTGKTSNYIANHFSQLEVFGWNDHVDENNIIEVIKTNPIKQLDISWSSKVTDKTIEAIIEYCGTNITSLNLEMCYQLTDNSIIQLVKKCTNIRHLILRNCESITDNGISIVARQCPLLHTLNIAGLHLLTDSSICNIATYCSQLERINLMGLRLITDISIDKLIEHCVDLYQVDTNNCDKITQAARLKLQEKDVSKKSAMELRW